VTRNLPLHVGYRFLSAKVLGGELAPKGLSRTTISAY